MRDFGYVRAGGLGEAVSLATRPRSRFVAGGTDLLNLMRDGVEDHHTLVDINSLPLKDVRADRDRVRIGALARMSDVAAHPSVREHLPGLTQALLAGASPQVRNMASIGGNLLQRTRCWYFRDPAAPCNKRVPGSGCAAIGGLNRWHAILGASESCIAVHPSDLAVALLALDAEVRTLSAAGERRIPLEDFYLPPGDTPHRETLLTPGELITGVEIGRTPLTATSRYLKLRDRATFEFAVVSVASAVRLSGSVVHEARLAFGGVAPRPWRSPEAERALVGRPLTDRTIDAAGRALVREAIPHEHNAFKIDLVRRALATVLRGGNR